MPALEKRPPLDPLIQKRIDEFLANPPDGTVHFAPATTPFDRTHPEYTEYVYAEGEAAYDALVESGIADTKVDLDLNNAYAEDARIRRLGHSANEAAIIVDPEG